MKDIWDYGKSLNEEDRYLLGNFDNVSKIFLVLFCIFK
jgi:hypothetical protein